MTLAARSRLGPYEILAPIGADGMGEVYRARDKKLDRDVAIKVLPEPLLKTPYVFSPGWLKIDPGFDPLRKNPRFQKLDAAA